MKLQKKTGFSNQRYNIKIQAEGYLGARGWIGAKENFDILKTAASSFWRYRGPCGQEAQRLYISMIRGPFLCNQPYKRCISSSLQPFSPTSLFSNESKRSQSTIIVDIKYQTGKVTVQRMVNHNKENHLFKPALSVYKKFWALASFLSNHPVFIF